MSKTVTREEWIAALESGEYCKAKNVMWDGQGFCCLGVLCNIAGVAPEDFQERYTADIRNTIGYREGEQLLESVGISQAVADRLAGLNDSCDTFGPVIRALRELDESSN